MKENRLQEIALEAAEIHTPCTHFRSRPCSQCKLKRESKIAEKVPELLSYIVSLEKPPKKQE